MKYFHPVRQDCSEHSEDDVDLAYLHWPPLSGPQLEAGLTGGRLVQSQSEINNDLSRVELPHWSRFSRYCDLIGLDQSVATTALLCHKDTAQGTQSSLLGVLFAFRWFFVA